MYFQNTSDTKSCALCLQDGTDVGHGSTEDVITAEILPRCQCMLVQQALPKELFGPSSGSTEEESGKISVDIELTTQ